MHAPARWSLATTARDQLTVLASLVRYWLGVLPRVRRELGVWRARARTIPDPVLRELALGTLDEETMNAEAAAVFATLAPRSRWKDLIALLVAFQAMYDYLDTVGEQPVADPLRNGLQLHRALGAALDPSQPTVDYYLHHSECNDGGYLDSLVAACRASLGALPAAAAVLPLARRAAERCGEGQSYTHAAMREGSEALAAWSAWQDRAEGYLWWEVAAGAISSVAVYALLAAAADPRTTPLEAARVDAAYFPPVCALSTLLDSLIDRGSDAATANLSSIGYYATNAEAAERLVVIADRADDAVRRLRRGRRHAAILNGIAGYYLSATGARTDYARLIAAAVIDRLGSTVPMILATVRLRRRIGRHDPGGS